MEFLFKFRVTPIGNRVGIEIMPYKQASPIPSDFLRGGEGKEPLLAEEYAEQAAKQVEEELEDPDWGIPDS